MDEKERAREIKELDALFGVEYELWDTKHILEHWDPQRHMLQMLNEWYGEEYYFPDTPDKLAKMERRNEGIPWDGREHIDFINEMGLPLFYLEWEVPEGTDGDDGEDSEDSTEE